MKCMIMQTLVKKKKKRILNDRRSTETINELMVVKLYNYYFFL